MERLKEYDELINKLNKTISDTSKTLSDTCRYVVFALLAFVWTLFIKEQFSINIDSILVLFFFILLSIYFIVDIVQYFYTLVRYRIHEKKMIEFLNILIDEGNLSYEQIENNILKSEAYERGKIVKMSYCLFISKFVILGLALICFLFIMKPFFV